MIRVPAKPRAIPPPHTSLPPPHGVQVQVSEGGRQTRLCQSDERENVPGGGVGRAAQTAHPRLEVPAGAHRPAHHHVHQHRRPHGGEPKQRLHKGGRGVGVGAGGDGGSHGRGGAAGAVSAHHRRHVGSEVRGSRP